MELRRPRCSGENLGLNKLPAEDVLILAKSAIIVLDWVCGDDDNGDLDFQFMLCDHKLMDDFPERRVHFINPAELAVLIQEIWRLGWIRIEQSRRRRETGEATTTDQIESFLLEIQRTPEFKLSAVRDWRYEVTSAGLDAWESIYLSNEICGVTFVTLPHDPIDSGHRYILYSSRRARLEKMSWILKNECDAELPRPIAEVSVDSSTELPNLRRPGPWCCEVALKKRLAAALPYALHSHYYLSDDPCEDWLWPQPPGTFLSIFASRLHKFYNAPSIS